MGLYDEFVDYERGRETQSKAFSNDMRRYEHDVDMNDVIEIYTGEMPTNNLYRTYYVQSYTPCFFIRIEGNLFTGIVSVNEDRVFDYPTVDYMGEKITFDSNYKNVLYDLADLFEIIENNASHLPMKQLRQKYTTIKFSVIDRISGDSPAKNEESILNW